MKVFESALSSFLGVFLSPRQKSLFSKYLDLLLEWNKKINLTSITDTEEIWFKHFLDSFTCIKVVELNFNKVKIEIVDVGTGAGFPGIPLKILFPHIQLTLADSVKKKTDFCQHIVQELGLGGVEVIHDRAEKLGKDDAHREKYDWVIARAVAQLSELAEYLLPLTKLGGKNVSYERV